MKLIFHDQNVTSKQAGKVGYHPIVPWGRIYPTSFSDSQTIYPVEPRYL
jgi:hypothetical protein